jgi:DNA-binding response OmpR family regulator
MRTLVIEDERKLATALRTGLEEQGYAVDVAHDGEEGLALATSEPYDLILLHILLLKLDGLAVCRRLRAAKHDVPYLPDDEYQRAQ